MSDVRFVLQELTAASWVAITRHKWGLVKLALAFALGVAIGCEPSTVTQEVMAQSVGRGRPAPTAPAGGTVTPAAPGDTTAHVLTLTSFGQRATGALYTVQSADCPTGWTRPVRQATASLTSTFTLINTGAWTTCSFTLYAWGTRGAEVSRDSTRIAGWSLTRPAEPVGPPPGGTVTPDTTTAPAPDTVVTPPPDPGPVAPWLVEDFSGYTSTAHLLSDPKNIYTAEDLGTAQIVLDQTRGLGSGQSMRYDFSARPTSCSSYTIGRNIALPAPVSELWAEYYVRFQPGFTTIVPGCTSNPDQKLVFHRVYGVSGRFGISAGNGGNEKWDIYPPDGSLVGSGIVEGWGPGEWATLRHPSQGTLFDDGAWHRIRFYTRINQGGVPNTGRLKMWHNDTVLLDVSTFNVTATSIYAIALGRNLNQGPVQAQSYWWGRVAVWRTNPGW